MIALDTSAIVAVALSEEEEEPFVRLITMGAIVGAPTLIETRLVLVGKLGSFGKADLFLSEFIDDPSLEVTPFTVEHFHAADLAMSRYGKGRGGKAQLNLGDCMSYAVAKHGRTPLLFKGHDFSHTDIRAAYP